MSVEFVAYIDESGDPGTAKVKPLDPDGSSEWLVVSCFLVRIDNDSKCVGWVKEIQSRFRNVQSPHLHFADLLPVKQRIACELLATKPARFFAVMSNKKNIRRYRNFNISDGNKNWLYWWLMRLLLERVTHFCEERIDPSVRGTSKLRIIFSRRGGMKYADFAAYMNKLRRQSSVGMLVLDCGDLCWSVIDDDEIFAYSHKDRAGLQLADVVAGALFQAVERDRPSDCDSACAVALRPRFAKDKFSRVLGYGIKTMPDLHTMDLAIEQRAVFEAYGYAKGGW